LPRRMAQAPGARKSVALLEAETFGSGASGHTGGMALAESAAGNLPGLGDVLSGYQKSSMNCALKATCTFPARMNSVAQRRLRIPLFAGATLASCAPLTKSPAAQLIPERSLPDCRSCGALRRSLFEHANVERANFKVRFSCHTPLGFSARDKSCLPPTPTPSN